MPQSLEQIVQQFDQLLAALAGGQPEDRAAIWGQALQESDFNPAAIEKPGTDSGGIDLWQHTGPRRRSYEAFAAALGKPWQDIETQVRFVGKELTSTYAHAWSQICNVAKTLQTKTETAMGLFEAPASWQAEIANPGTTTANLPRRVTGAKRALAVITAQQGAGKVTDTSGTTAATPVQPNTQAIAEALTEMKQKLLDMETKLAAQQGMPSFLVQIAENIEGKLIDALIAKVSSIDLAAFLQQELSAVIGSVLKPKA